MTDLPGRRPPPISEQAPSLKQRLDNLRHLGRLIAQIWRTSRPMTAASIGLRLIAALQPIAVLYAAKLIVDEVVHLTSVAAPGPSPMDWWNAGLLTPVLFYLLLEMALVLANDAIGRATGLVDSILSELHSNQVSTELMAHAARLDLMHFESAEYQDRLERARRQAAGRNALLSQLLGRRRISSLS